MDLSRATNPLSAAVRVGFALVVLAGLAADTWINSASTARSPTAALLLVAALGIGWCFRPTAAATPVVAGVAALLSLLATARSPHDGRAFAFFTEFVVLPVLFGAVLAGASSLRGPVAAVVAVAAGSIAFRAEAGPIRWIVAASMLVLLGGAATAIVYIRLRDQERRTSVDLARQSERLALARELHDVVGHHVTGIVVLAQANRFTTTGVGPLHGASAETRRTFAEIETAGLETLTSVRRIVGLLREGPVISAGPTLAEIEDLIDDLRRTHPDTDLVIDAPMRSAGVPSDLAPTVQRLVQELTTNVRKHGDPAAPITFELRRIGTSIALSAENGSMAGHPGSGYGLVGMGERVEALGGTFTAGPHGVGRWAVRATLPLAGAERS